MGGDDRQRIHALAMNIGSIRVDLLRGKAPKEGHDYKDAFEHLDKVLDSYCTEASHQSIAIEMKTFLALSHTAKSLVMSLAQEI